MCSVIDHKNSWNCFRSSTLLKFWRDLEWINALLELFQFRRDKFSTMQYPNNELECKEMESIPYASIVGGLMYI